MMAAQSSTVIRRFRPSDEKTLRVLAPEMLLRRGTVLIAETSGQIVCISSYNIIKEKYGEVRIKCIKAMRPLAKEIVEANLEALRGKVDVILFYTPISANVVREVLHSMDAEKRYTVHLMRGKLPRCEPQHTVRDFTPDDMEDVLHLEAETFDDYWAWERASFYRINAIPSIIFLVSERDGDFAGYIIGNVAGTRVEVLSLAVRRKHRRVGIGTALLCELAKRARDMGAHEMVLQTAEEFTGSVEFYKKMKLRTAGIFEVYALPA